MVLMFSIVLSRTYKTVSLCLSQLCIFTFLLCVKWNKNSSKTGQRSFDLFSFKEPSKMTWAAHACVYTLFLFFSYYLYVNVDRAQEISCSPLWHLHLLVQLQDSQIGMEALSEGLCTVFYAVFYAVCSQCIVLLFFSLFYCHWTVHQSVPRSQNFLHFLTWSWTIVSRLSELLNNILSLDIDNFFICFQLSLSSIHFQGMF